MFIGGRTPQVLDYEQIAELEEARRFLHFLKRPPHITYGLLGLMVVYFITTLFMTPSMLDALTQPEMMTPALLRLGAKFPPLMEQGQWWRTITALFLHGGLVHLLLNGFSLYSVGMIAENLYGKPRYILLFFLTGVLSILASYWTSASISVGASGAIFGIVGALATIGQIRKKVIPVRFRVAFGRNLLFLIGLNLVVLMGVPRIDHAAHIAGLLGGVGFAFLFKDKLLPPVKSRRQILRIQIFSAATALVAVIALLFGGLHAAGNQAMPFPENTEYRELDDLGISIEVLSGMEELRDAAFPNLVSFIEPGTLFAVEVGLLAPRFEDRHEAMRWMLATMRNLYGDRLLKITIDPVSDGNLDGRRAWGYIMDYSIKGLGERKEQQWIATTNDKTLLLTCSSPNVLFPSMGTWCDSIRRSVTYR